MHTITVSIQGDVSVTESIQVDDAEALPLFIGLKALLQTEDAAKPARRRGRPRKEKQIEVDSTPTASLEARPIDSEEA